MNVLISYTTDGQISIIKGLADCLVNRGVDVLVWNRTTHNCFTNNAELFNSNISFFNGLKRYPRYVLIVLYHLPFFLSLLTRKGFKGIDILNYHFHEGLCDRLLPFLKKNKIKLMISIWGSDLYRISNREKEARKHVYPQVDLIHVESPEVKKDFLNVFKVDEGKVVSCNYGVSLFENIDKLRDQKESIKKELLPKEAEERIIVTCGYNARRGQQHQIMIQELMKLPQAYKDKVFIVFPLTYTVVGDSFLEEIDDALSSFDIPYISFKKHLVNDELAKLRLVSDAVINIQITDSLSTSLVEYIYAGNIMLLAEWLPYSFLTNEYGIKYHPIGINSIGSVLKDIIDNYSKEVKEGNNNVKRVGELSSWESVSNRFFQIFQAVYGLQK